MASMVLSENTLKKAFGHQIPNEDFRNFTTRPKTALPGKRKPFMDFSDARFNSQAAAPFHLEREKPIEIQIRPKTSHGPRRSSKESKEMRSTYCYGAEAELIRKTRDLEKRLQDIDIVEYFYDDSIRDIFPITKDDLIVSDKEIRLSGSGSFGGLYETNKISKAQNVQRDTLEYPSKIQNRQLTSSKSIEDTSIQARELELIKQKVISKSKEKLSIANNKKLLTSPDNTKIEIKSFPEHEERSKSKSSPENDIGKKSEKQNHQYGYKDIANNKKLLTSPNNTKMEMSSPEHEDRPCSKPSPVLNERGRRTEKPKNRDMKYQTPQPKYLFTKDKIAHADSPNIYLNQRNYNYFRMLNKYTNDKRIKEIERQKIRTFSYRPDRTDHSTGNGYKYPKKLKPILRTRSETRGQGQLTDKF